MHDTLLAAEPVNLRFRRRVGSRPGVVRVQDCRIIGRLILEVFEALRVSPEGDAATEQRVRREIFALCERFPIY